MYLDIIKCIYKFTKLQNVNIKDSLQLLTSQFSLDVKAF